MLYQTLGFCVVEKNQTVPPTYSPTFNLTGFTSDRLRFLIIGRQSAFKLTTSVQYVKVKVILCVLHTAPSRM